MERLRWLLLVGLLAMFPFHTFAQMGIQVDTNEVRLLDVTPGQTETGTLRVTNKSGRNFTIKTSLGEFTYQAPFAGARIPLPAGSISRSSAEWISVTPSVFDLAPGETKEVAYSVKVPEGVTGGYYSMLFFEFSPAAIEGRIGVGVNVRIGCAFFVETADKDKGAAIEDISVRDNTLNASFSNTGNVIMIAKGSYYAMDDQGMVIDRGKIKDIYLPMEEKAPFKIDLSSALGQGKYTLVITFDLGEGDALVKEIDFSKSTQGTIKILATSD